MKNIKAALLWPFELISFDQILPLIINPSILIKRLKTSLHAGVFQWRPTKDLEHFLFREHNRTF
jgi:hypothetical protein